MLEFKVIAGTPPPIIKVLCRALGLPLILPLIAIFIPFVFEKFYLLENAANKGTGLGLSIVKGFTEAQNGTIKLKNAEEGGAVFELTFVVDSLPINSLNNE